MARFANFKGFQTNDCLFDLDPWIPGSHMARFVNFKGFQTNDCLFDLDPWIPGSQMARFANFKGFQTLTIFLAWIPGSLDPTRLDL